MACNQNEQKIIRGLSAFLKTSKSLFYYNPSRNKKKNSAKPKPYFASKLDLLQDLETSFKIFWKC